MFSLIKSKIATVKQNRALKKRKKIETQNLIFLLSEHMGQIGLPGRCRNFYREPIRVKEISGPASFPVEKKEKKKKVEKTS